MPTPTYTPLATVTLGTSASSVTFSSIPATYRDLILIFSGKATSSGADVRYRLNSDTGANYNNVRMYGFSSSAASDSQSGATFIDPMGLDTADGAMVITQFMDYSATDKHKTFLSRAQTSATSVIFALASRWANTAAVNNIQVYTGSHSFAIGTTINLYGVIA
jgi:hypothetical protein